jgi:hypothetical protein
MRIDVHTRFLPGGFQHLLRDWDKSVRIEDCEDGPVVIHTAGSFPLLPDFRDIDTRLRTMRRDGRDCY